MTALFAGILVQPPFFWSFDALGYVFAGQVATAVAVPIFCGYLSDQVMKIMSRKNGGVTEVWLLLDENWFILTLYSLSIDSSL
jgi:hypothetical protein